MSEKLMLAEALCYFREREVYAKLFAAMRKKYEGLGYFGGSVLLGALSQAERLQLGGFLQKDFEKQRVVSISMRTLENSLEKSRFSELNWKEIVEAYDQKALLAKQEHRNKEEEERKQFFVEMEQRYTQHEMGFLWITQLQKEKGEGYYSLMQQYKDDKQGLKKLLTTFLNTLVLLPYQNGTSELLPVFAAKATGNPHFYDDGTPAFRLLLSFLKFVFSEGEQIGMSRVEQRNRLLFAAGIIKDELSNYTTAYGIRAITKEGKPHLGIEGYAQMREPVQVSLWTLGGLEELNAEYTQKVYVVENPAIFARIIRENPECTAVCSNGQPRLATLLLLDALTVKSKILYAGDFDPEGLLIAQRLKERYREKLEFWKYESRYYENYLSEVVLDEKRLKKLKNITHPELQGIRNAMENRKRATYQEAMIEILLSDK